MRRLICAFVVLLWHEQVFSWRAQICCGTLILESSRQGDSNEHSEWHCILSWRPIENKSFIIVKYPPCSFCTGLWTVLISSHTCHKLWTDFCEIRQVFKGDLIIFCDIFTKITLELPQNSQKPLFKCKKLVINTTKCDLCLFLHKI